MSDLSNQNGNDHEHQSPIKTPKQLVMTVLAAFIVPIVCIVLLVQYVTNDRKMGAGSNGDTPEAVAARISPVADQGFTLKDESGPKVLQSGGAVYTAFCAACHATGAAGSPKFGDSTAWAPRIAQGYDTLVLHATKGIRGMPAKGGNPDLDDVEVARAVAYMANKGGASFKEPEAKAAAPAAAATDAAPVAAAPSKTADAGKALYDSTCMACHASGVLGAPKFGDKTAWADRIKQGPALLHEHAIKGIRGMPPKGGSAASEDDVKAAVDYMTAAAK